MPHMPEFQGQLLSQADLTTFFGEFVKNAKSGDDKVFKYVGDNQQGEGVEANLDIQYIMGVAAGIKTEAWQYTPSDFCSDLKTWTQATIAEIRDSMVAVAAPDISESLRLIRQFRVLSETAQ